MAYNWWVVCQSQFRLNSMETRERARERPGTLLSQLARHITCGQIGHAKKDKLFILDSQIEIPARNENSHALAMSGE